MKCTHCGSERIIPRASIWDSGQHSMGELNVYLYARPNAMIFRETTYGTLYARICADCGHTELFTSNAAELYEAHLRSQSEA